MWKMLADSRMALLVGMVLVGQSAYQSYQPGTPYLWAKLMMATLPAILILSIVHLLIRNRVGATNDSQKISNQFYFALYAVVLIIGVVAFLSRH